MNSTNDRLHWETEYKIRLEDNSDVTDVLTLSGPRRRKIRDWRMYLKTRLGIDSISQCNTIARGLGFYELINSDSINEYEEDLSH